MHPLSKVLPRGFENGCSIQLAQRRREEAMFVVLFLKSWAQFVEMLDLNVGFNPGKIMFSSNTS